MKKLGFLMLTLLIMVFSVGCGNSTEGDTPDTTAKATAAESEEDMVIIKGINATDVIWVFDQETYGSSEYRGEIDAIHAKDFSVDPGGSVRKCQALSHGMHKNPMLKTIDNAEHPQSYESGCSLCMHKPKSLALTLIALSLIKPMLVR